MGILRGRPFEPGNRFGRGRPKGSRNRRWEPELELLEEHGAAILKRCILLAMQGDRHALRLCVERLLPVRRDRSIRVKAMPLGTAADVNAYLNTVLQQMSKGQLTPAEAETIGRVAGEQRRGLELIEFEERLAKLEARQEAA